MDITSINRDKYQQKLISSITQQIGIGKENEVNNSLNLLLELTKENNDSIKIYQTPIMLLIDYISGFNKSQIRLLYKIFSLLSINIDSNQELQIGNNLLILVTKQMSHSGDIHQQNAGIIGCIQLIHCISTQIAYKTKNGISESIALINKLISNVQHNVQLFATLCDEYSLMIENSRNILNNDEKIPWSQYLRDNDDDDDDDNDSDFYPIHDRVLNELHQWAINMVGEMWAIHDNDGSQSIITQKPQFQRIGLEPQMWANLSSNKIRIRNQNQNHNGMDSEATECTDNDDIDDNTLSSDIYIRITPIFVAQDMSELMWIFSPLFRVFGILSNAIRGELQHIDSFLTAPLVMFNEEYLETALCIDKSKKTRQIMGDSIFSAINCIRELLNIFCAEYIESIDDDNNNYNNNNSNISQSHSRRIRIETRLCHRFDHLVALEYKLKRFMKININKQFLPSFIPSQNVEQTWLNSPPWKRKMLFNQENKKKKPKKEEKNKKKKPKKEDENDENDENLMLSSEDQEDENNNNHNHNKRKKGKQKKKSPKNKKPSKSKKKSPQKSNKKKKSPAKKKKNCIKTK